MSISCSVSYPLCSRYSTLRWILFTSCFLSRSPYTNYSSYHIQILYARLLCKDNRVPELYANCNLVADGIESRLHFEERWDVQDKFIIVMYFACKTNDEYLAVTECPTLHAFVVLRSLSRVLLVLRSIRVKLSHTHKQRSDPYAC